MSGLHLQGLDNATLANPQAIMNAHAKSFSWAARFLAPQSRRDSATLYAFARLADDLVDEERLGTLEQRLDSLRVLRNSVLDATGSENTFQLTDRSHLANLQLGTQLAQVLADKDIHHDVLAYFMDSLQADAEPRQLQTVQELLTFAYGVAGTVGLMMRPILGAPKTADACAMALGIGMQLSNIARDVVEDAQRERCYIPAQWGVGLEDLKNIQHPPTSAACFNAVKKMIHFADGFYGYAQTGIALIPSQNRRAIYIATTLYRGIGQKILRQGEHIYWQGRTSLSAFEKSKLITHCLLRLTKPPSAPKRDIMASDLAHLSAIAGFRL